MIAIASAAACAAAPASRTPRLTAAAKPPVLQYTRAVRIDGRLASGRRGVPVILEANPFPFSSGFTQVARLRTRKGGAYAFAKRPSHATRYMVNLAHRPSTRSRTVSVHVEPLVSDLSCNLCGVARRRSGSYTLHLRFKLRYPADVYATESSKPVYFYYGQRNGSARHPRALDLVKTVPQQPLHGNRTGVAISHRVRLPNTYSFRVATCTQTSGQTDGFGLSGAPGSHHCGDASIAYRQSRYWLG